MDGWKTLGLAALAALYLGTSSCGKKDEPAKVAAANPIEMSINDLDKGILDYEGKFVKTGAVITDIGQMEDILLTSSSSGNTYGNSLYFTLSGGNDAVGSEIVSSQQFTRLEASNYKMIQKLRSDMNMMMRKGETVFVTGWINDGVLDYTKITDSKGNIIFEDKNLEEYFTFSGKVTDIYTTPMSSGYLKVISLDTESGQKKFQSFVSSDYPETYGNLKNAHVTIRAHKGLGMEIYSSPSVDIDVSYSAPECPVDKKDFFDKMFKRVGGPEEIATYKTIFGELTAKENGNPSLENALDLSDLSILVKFEGQKYQDKYNDASKRKKKKMAPTLGEQYRSLSREISDVAIQKLKDHGAYSLAIESCRQTIGDAQASDLAVSLIIGLDSDGEYYRAAQLANKYCRNITSTEAYIKTVTELSRRGLWNNAIQVAEEADIGTEKMFEIFEDARKDIRKSMKHLEQGTEVYTGSAYLSQKDKESKFAERDGSGRYTGTEYLNDIVGKIVSFSNDYGRATIEGLRIAGPDSIPIRDEFPVIFIQKK